MILCMIYDGRLNFKELKTFVKLQVIRRTFQLSQKQWIVIFWVLNIPSSFSICFTECNTFKTRTKPPSHKACERRADKSWVFFVCSRSFSEIRKNTYGRLKERFVFTLKMATLFHSDPFLAVTQESVLRFFHYEHSLT